jgi:uncharacterized LabA/DUF88 family protein
MTQVSYSKPRIASNFKENFLRTSERASIVVSVAGTILAGLSQQVAFACVPMSMSLIIMSRNNGRRYEQEQKILMSRKDTIVNVQQAVHPLKQQIDNLSIDINKLKQTQIGTVNNRYLTKTHLTPIINKLHQVQRQHKAIELGAIANLTQTVSTLQQELSQLQKNTVEPVSILKVTDNRVAVFIDASNIYHVGKELDINVNYKKLRALLKGESKSFQGYFYTGVNSANQKEKQFLSNICSLGYKIIGKEIIRQPDGIKANLDVELALDMHHKALNNEYDTAILVSGDGDFIDVVKRLQELGKRVEVVSFRKRTNKELIKVADAYLDLTEISHEIQ